MLGDVPAGCVAVYACGQDRRSASRRALGDVAEGTWRRRLRARRWLPGRALHPRGGLPGVLRPHHARGLDLALGARGDAGADHGRARCGSSRATGWSETTTAWSSCPQALAESVLAEAEEKAATESEIRVAVREGMLPARGVRALRHLLARSTSDGGPVDRSALSFILAVPGSVKKRSPWCRRAPRSSLLGRRRAGIPGG